MKRFTKISLRIAGFFFGLALVCLVIGLMMGIRVSDVEDMIRNGVLSYGPEDGFHIQILKNDKNKVSSEKNDTEHELSHTCTKLYLELSAGEIDISYGDVDYIQIQQQNIPGFSVVSNEEEQSVRIQGDVNVVHNSAMKLTMILPRDVELEEMHLEIGASDARVQDIITKELVFVVGAGQAKMSNLSAEKFELEVGAGEAIAENLSAKELDIEAGVGRVDIEIAGAEKDYNYDVECGIGEVAVGTHSWSGLGATQSITKDGAIHQMHISCGIGEVNVHFMH